jgi:hypothetical protein
MAAQMSELVQPDDRGRLTVALDDLVPYRKNPRNPEDFVYPTNPAFKELVESINRFGVLEPIQVFIGNGEGRVRAHMITGHRRREAVLRVNRLRAEAREAPGRTAAADGADVIDLTPIERIPVTVIPQPPSDFDRQKGMWNSEVLREKWPFNRTIEFFRETYEAAPIYLKDDPKELAKNLGLPVSRVKLLVEIVKSSVLFDAARGNSLPLSGREKTLRSVNRVANVVYAERESAARALTGAVVLDDRALEVIRHQALTLAEGIPQPGVTLEQLAPQLRDAEKHPDSLVVRMMRGDSEARNEILSGFEGTSRRRSQEGSPLDVLKNAAHHFCRTPFAESPLDALSSAETGVLEVVEQLEAALVRIRSARRARS